ncbi:MAG: hypothetical protein ACFCUJ_09125 [Thiotrichales bacterium]
MTPALGRTAPKNPDNGYVLLAPLRAERAEFSFRGTFDGITVTWRTVLEVVIEPRGEQCPNFIEIAPTSERDVLNLRVGLRLQRIDDATIRKTMIMIRNYKRLRIGRHAFGTA